MFTVGIPILVKWHLHIETTPGDWSTLHLHDFLSGIFQVLCGRINSLRPRQNVCYFPDDIFKQIFMNENAWIPIKISLKFVPRSPINNVPAWFQIIAWCRPGNKPLSEPMMAYATYICVSWPQWVNVTYMCAHITYTCPYHVLLNILLNLCYTCTLYCTYTLISHVLGHTWYDAYLITLITVCIMYMLYFTP